MRRLATAASLVGAIGCGPLVAFDGDADTGTGDADDGAPADDTGRQPAPDTGEAGGPPGSDVDDGGDGDDGGGTTSDSACGDGIVEPGERCDDGNAEPGDGCELDCTPTPGLLLWSRTFDGAGGGDFGNAVATDGNGLVVAAGSMRLDGGDDAWLAVLDTEGNDVSAHSIDLGSDELATALALSPSGRIFAAGVQPPDDRALLLRLDDDGLVAIEPVPTDIVGFGAALAPTSTGLALVTHAFGDDGLLATISLRDADGAPMGDVPLPADVFVGMAVPTPAGGVWLAGSQRPDQNIQNAWLGAAAADGSLAWTFTADAVRGLETRIRSVAMLEDGRLAAVGTRGMGGPGDGPEAGWIWWLTGDGVLESDGPLDIGGASSRPSSVVAGNHGLVVAGTIAAKDDGFVAGLAQDGTLQWGFELAGEQGFEDRVSALAVVPGHGIAAIGTITQPDTDEDVWVGLFSD